MKYRNGREGGIKESRRDDKLMRRKEEALVEPEGGGDQPSHPTASSGAGRPPPRQPQWEPTPPVSHLSSGGEDQCGSQAAAGREGKRGG
ncbi:hypothetical protein OPV22_001662 [Ensete ventricosum]|uniref:Uncharacterized protein n=1 Tax=Ensete ventricosum TaxID=4639 RepID=A0A427B7S8_ENSVE|nr:hypothetical protein OPV22_001662 [Ensete ventricosum]RRT84513.1 hypothetical protein B296_00000322 [Ensete ventricosum]RWW79718.1 hypothetical protein BHE74_00011977 [Ensete ventricosum]